MKLTGAQILWECAGARRRDRRVRLSRAARFCRPTTRCSTIRSATSWSGTSRARRTWPTATRARAARSASRSRPPGPGATNMVTGIATAMMDSSPIVCITGQVGSKLIGSDAFQETDITGITLPITKHNYLVTRAEDVAPAVREAFAVARVAAARARCWSTSPRTRSRRSCEFDWDAAEPHLTEALRRCAAGRRRRARRDRADQRAPSGR